jgi:hypothetical protein
MPATDADTVVLENFKLALEDLRNSLSRREYKKVPQAWDEIWFIALAPFAQDELPTLRQHFGREVGRLIETTRLHIKQKRISGEVSPRLQSIATKIAQ